MNKIAFVTSNFGGVDRVKPLPAHPGIDAILYTDMPRILDTKPVDMATWDRVTVNPLVGYSDEPWLRSRFFKQQMHTLPEMREYDYLVWADASLLFRDMSFINVLCDYLPELPANERALFVPHPDRRFVEDEYDFVCERLKQGDNYLQARYDEEQMTKQMYYLEASGINCAQTKLWCAGFFVLQNSMYNALALNNWWKQTKRFGRMDQLSLSAAFSLEGVRVRTLKKDMNVYQNEFFCWRKGL